MKRERLHDGINSDSTHASSSKAQRFSESLFRETKTMLQRNCSGNHVGSVPPSRDTRSLTHPHIHFGAAFLPSKITTKL